MPQADESLLLDETLDDESPLLEDDNESLDADEEMSGEPDEGDSEDDESALEDDDEDADPDALDDEEEEDNPVSRQEYEQFQAEKRQLAYEQEQARYRRHWANIQGEAEEAFAWERDQIKANKDRYVDPDAYETNALAELADRRVDWYRRFYASIEQAKSEQREKALIPVYAARIATKLGLTKAQAKDLLNYPHDQMLREAKKYQLHNQQLARLKKGKQQASRKAEQIKVTGKVPPSGTGRTPASRVKAGSMAHLQQIFAAAQSA